MRVCTLGVFVSLLAFPGFAGTVLDFPTWTAANGHSSYTLDGVSLTANIGNLAISSSGVGINVGRLDYATQEINQIEVLSIAFDHPVDVMQMVFAKLNANEGIPPLTFNEQGQYRVNSAGAWTTFTGNSAGGSLTLNLLITGVSKLEFRPANPSAINVLNDYAVQSVTLTPEPATGLLAGCAMAALVAYRRRNR